MADKISINLGQLEGVVNIKTLLDEQKLNSIVKTIENALSNVDIKKYLKGTDDLLNDLQIAFSNFNKEQSKVNAKELLNVSNVLKALGVDISDVIPEFDKINSAISQAGKLAHAMDGVINVKQFKDAAVAIAELSENGVNVAEMFERLGTSADTNALKKQIDDLSDSLENAGRKNEKLRDRNSSLLDELYKVKSGSRVTELEEQLEELRSLRDRTVEEFKQSLGYFDLDEHQFDLYPYIKNIEEGVYSAKGALADFKSNYRYLFEDAFNNKQNIGTDQFDKLESSLTEVLKVVQETSAGIKELQNQIDMFSVPGIEDDFKGSDESLKQILNLFGQINDSLSSLRSVISDVGDGEEFSPLLKTIKEITTAVDTLSKSVSNIGLNVNIESGGMDQKLLSSLDAKKQSLLSAYKTQFDAMRAFKPSGATVAMANPENRSRIAALNKQINNFDGGANTDNIDQRITAYKEIIKLMKEVSQLSYGKDIYSDMDSSFKNAVSSATGQVTRVQNELKKANTDGAGLENLFGSQDLSKVVEQLGRIADQFENIAKAASEFKAKFADGIKVESSVQEIETLTKKVKELEKEISKLKTGSETNISTPKNTTSDTAGASAKDSKVSIEGEADKLKETAQNATEAANAKLKFVDANKKVKDSAKDSADAVQGESDSFKNVNTDPYSTYVQNVYKAWQQADKINDALSETQQKFQSIENTFGKSATGGSRFEELFPGVTDAVKELDNKLQQSKISVASYKSQIKDLLETKPNNLANSNQLYSEANQINTALINVEKTVNGLTVPSNFQNDFANVKTKVEQLNEELKQGKISVSEYNTAIDNSLGSLSDSIQNQLMSQSQLLSSVRSAINSANKNVEKQELKPSEVNRSDTFGKQIAEYKNAISELSAAYDSIKGKDFISDEEAAKVSQLQNKVEALGLAFKSLDSSQKGSTEISRSKLYDKIGEYLQKNTRISAEFRSQLIALQEELKFKGADANVNKIATAFFNLKGNIKDAGQEGRRLLDIINDKAFYGFAAQIAGMFSVQDGLRLAQNAINTVVELDTALVDLKKTTSMTSTELNKFYYDANDVAKQMGVTTQEIIEQASAWSRLGYSSKEASTEMARLSSKFAAISPGMDTTEAQEGLVSIMKAFDVETSEVESKIINKINVLGNKFAENNQDVVEGLKRSSAAMAAMNQSFEDTAALFTGGMEILQDAESMGTALRTLSMRMRGYSEETGELDNELVNLKGDVLDLTKTANNAQGISIFTDATQQHYKSMVQYLGEIADEWDQISEVNQTALIQKLFGKNRAQAGAAILGNFNQVRKAIQEMEDSAGSADREMEAIESSLEFKINRLKETWVGTAQQIADRGDIGKGIDALYEVSEAIGFIIDKVGILNIGIVGITAALGRGRSQERFCPIW